MHSVLIFLGFLLVVGNGSGAFGASQKAMALRQANRLEAYTPPERFLAGNFIADEMDPGYIFGTVKNFAGSRKCRTTWLVEEGLKHRLASPGSSEASAEYTLYLEEDCPEKVIYYVFVDQSSMTLQQWLEWRRQFHKSKTDPQFGAAKEKLERAAQEGCAVSGELRYIQKDGELVPQSPEEILRGDLKFPPIYDLNRQKQTPKQASRPGG
jgi:hypothetical protein